MRTRTFISGLVFLPTNAVLFGIGALLVLTIPALRAHAVALIPVVVVLSFAIAAPLAWYIAPRLRLRSHSR